MVITKITAGDTLTFTKSVSGYAPEDGWTLSYALVSPSLRITFNATDNGDSTHLVTVAAATTATWAAGSYKWQSYVTKAAERFSVESGTFQILTNFATASSGSDARSHVRKVLDALDATIEGKATKDQISYSISFGDSGASRSISRMSFSELIEARKYYKSEYQRLLRQERLARGLDSGKTIHIRMSV